ncbi:MAG: aminotransferase class IV [Treponema sp.]|jgi:branched-chain amino acid aminotransferase|nr:aminotransferase class IV [Treponema sp.]
MAFNLNCYPISYRAKYTADGKWAEEFLEKPHKTPEEEARLSPAEAEELANSRNYYGDMPLVNYTTQYGLGCFEGLKALPQMNGSYAIFRPSENAKRFYDSMQGLYMPPFPQETFLKALKEMTRRNIELGFCPVYKAEWEKDSFSGADSIYLRPFSYSEGGIGVNISRMPWVVMAATPVSAYFSAGTSDAIVTERIRATSGGTGMIKANSNYVISVLARHEAAEQGYMESIFLDAEKRRYVEEGSSSNIFFYLKSGELVTPELGDTILPGITRLSLIELARDRGVKVTERKIAIEEAFSDAKECFVCGTAAGATPLSSITWNGKKVSFNYPGELATELQKILKGIQYGVLPDDKGWLLPVV